MIHSISLFGEDQAHYKVVDALVRRIADQYQVDVQLQWRNATGGRGKALQEYHRYLRDLAPFAGPDLVVVTTDANCKGLNERIKEFRFRHSSVTTVFAIPDPHIERWLLLDGAAFRATFGRGCNAPDQKCNRDRYKELLRAEIRKTGKISLLGGTEHAEQIIRHIDIDRAARLDISFQRFVNSLRSVFRGWAQ